ncbi:MULTISPECIES: pyrimidine utilization protein D [unclassified Acinetobacter]|uniref:pyrimidine utilization protein D n=1 Tax=unclassified Acinetobacter TaxID=196816 RepID=UPI00190CBB81|nr:MULTISPECIES: pyrimidine utilization protein D [unclassified Acinetobacter]MBK0064316.1 pyrimidine utilization protein D [Acinetobacter sp. S55]MBK0067692.1 pyrimidine utilization protein D [Acinetobacter sp. S54]
MNYQLYPALNESQEYVVFSSGLGGHGQFWQPQIAAFQQTYHVLIYDHEGCHADSRLLPESYSFGDLAEQIKNLLLQLNIHRFHFIGHAIGGFIGIELMQLLDASELDMQSLTVINGWADLDPHTLKCFQTRLALLEHAGIAAYVAAQALFLYPPSWISQYYLDIEQQEQKQQRDFPPIQNVIRRIAALMHFQITPEHLAKLAQRPVLLIANQDDMLVPYHQSLKFWKLVPQAHLYLMAEGGHASTVTQTPLINHQILKFLHQSR